MAKLKIKKGATVEVTTGSEKGKRGSVLEIRLKDLKIKVQGVKVQTKHDRKDGLVKREGFIDYSNVRLVESAPTKKKTAKKVSKEASKEA